MRSEAPLSRSIPGIPAESGIEGCHRIEPDSSAKLRYSKVRILGIEPHGFPNSVIMNKLAKILVEFYLDGLGKVAFIGVEPLGQVAHADVGVQVEFLPLQDIAKPLFQLLHVGILQAGA